MLGHLVYPKLVQQTYRCSADVFEVVADGIEHDQVLRISADRKKNIVLSLCRDALNARIQHDRRMISQPCREAGAPTGRIDLGRQQFGGIDLANEILEFKVRTPEESFPKNISKRKNEHTRLARLALHGYLTCPYQTRSLQNRRCSSLAKSICRGKIYATGMDRFGSDQRSETRVMI
jgi:hypothetical protein